MPEVKRVVVYDKAQKRRYPVPADAVIEEGLEVVEGEDGSDHKGDPVAIQYGVTKTGEQSKSGQQAESKEK